jgi:hypothetical protein
MVGDHVTAFGESFRPNPLPEKRRKKSFTRRQGVESGVWRMLKSRLNHVTLGLERRVGVFGCPLQHTRHVTRAV